MAFWNRRQPELNLHVTVHVHPSEDLENLLNGMELRLMSNIEDAVAQLKSEVAAATQRVADDIAARVADLSSLQQQLDTALANDATDAATIDELRRQIANTAEAIQAAVQDVRNIDPSTSPAGEPNVSSAPEPPLQPPAENTGGTA